MKNNLVYLLTVSILTIIGCQSLASAESGPSVRRGVSDRWLTWRIDALLKNDNRFDYRGVKITTKAGIVDLKGSVMTEYEKAHAAFVASDIPQVKGVVNDIMVEQPGTPDLALAGQIRSEIIQDPIFNVGALDVDANDGGVILHGIVRTPEQKKLIGEFVREIPGVEHLTNDLLVE